jgi:hypothetical protein
MGLNEGVGAIHSIICFHFPWALQLLMERLPSVKKALLAFFFVLTMRYLV